MIVSWLSSGDNLIKIGSEFLIDIQGKKIKAKIIEEPAFDPKNLRLKS